MSDEEVIKRRLLIDGDGTGDDRRINVLLKSFIKWTNTSDTPENTQAGYDRMLANLAQCELAVKKSEFTEKMMQQEMRNYATISSTIESGIEHAKSQIEQSKENLVTAKKIRKNRMEYDALAKIINQQPDRKKTTEKLEALKKELHDLEANRRKLKGKLEIRRNEFTVLMRSIKELQTKLDADNDKSITDDDNNENDNDDEIMKVYGDNGNDVNLNVDDDTDVVDKSYDGNDLEKMSVDNEFEPTGVWGNVPLSICLPTSPSYTPTSPNNSYTSPNYTPASPKYSPLYMTRP